ncbi:MULTISPECIES: SMI1/KNR4 family protein [unclassified Escherichia]|uniref:SMI1/KNR4 family protein n=1 Tax=unclassified Escherichia TaxID=2608889 RepID=UPI000CF672CB|nr:MULTISPECIES: SMI1/KNR4 family protein [unclassified Escherichia]
MNDIDELLDLIKSDNRCEVIPPDGNLPLLPYDYLKYPDDVIRFYKICNGIKLFCSEEQEISFTILKNNEILQANKFIVGEPCEDDISSSWYLICRTDNNDYLSIDFSTERNGRCYDSNYEIHGVVGSCPIIAMSFTELLNKLYSSGGQYIYWKDENYGDAYD